jgi:hypothetical protein
MSRRTKTRVKGEAKPQPHLETSATPGLNDTMEGRSLLVSPTNMWINISGMVVAALVHKSYFLN